MICSVLLHGICVQEGSWTIKSIGMIGMDRNKVEQYIASIGAKSLGEVQCVYLLVHGVKVCGCMQISHSCMVWY